MKKALFIVCVGLLSLMSFDVWAQRFQTRSDTLTIQQGEYRHIELYPGWNDEKTGKVLYADGGYFYNVQPIFTNEYHCRFYQSGAFYYPTEHLGGYAVDIPHLKDAFALEYILVRYIDGLEIPGISVREIIKVGKNFTVTLTGTPELMTSWTPEITITGVDAEFVSRDGWTYTYIAKTAGTMEVTLHHNSLQVLPDTTVICTIIPTSVADDMPITVSIYPNPVQDILYLELGDIVPVSLTLSDFLGNTWKDLVPTATTVRVGDLPTGVYYLKITTKDTFFIHKIIKH